GFRDPHPLPSFPTRRSSDLARRPSRRMGGKIVGHVLRDAPIGAPQDEGKKWKDKMSLLEVKDLKVRVEDNEILHGLTLTVNPGEDRKSTRLNSSHVAISYAV